MIELQPISLDSKSELEAYLAAEGSRSADYNFGNIFMWDRRFKQFYRMEGSRIVMLFERLGAPCFAFPVGSGDIEPALDCMRQIAAERGFPLMISGIEKKHLELLPEGFELSEDRDFSDYVYSIKALSSYVGKRLHAKRNFCNRFEAEHEWHFELLNEELIQSCKEMLESWLHKSEDRLEETIDYEKTAIYQGFAHYSELGLEGGALFIEDKLVGFSVGEHCAPDTFCVHFEKAYADIDGAYAILCRESARLIKTLHPEVCYVNREDDMGKPSLRQSKLSYKPEYILEKYTALWKR